MPITGLELNCSRSKQTITSLQPSGMETAMATIAARLSSIGSPRCVFSSVPPVLPTTVLSSPSVPVCSPAAFPLPLWSMRSPPFFCECRRGGPWTHGAVRANTRWKRHVRDTEQCGGNGTSSLRFRCTAAAGDESQRRLRSHDRTVRAGRHHIRALRWPLRHFDRSLDGICHSVAIW